MFDFLQKLKIIEILILLRTINGSGPCLDQAECTFDWTLNYRLLTWWVIIFLLVITTYDLFDCSKNYSRYTMSCFEKNKENYTEWYPVALNDDRKPFLTENTYYETNKSRVFENTENCIFGSGSKAGVIETNGYFPAGPMKVFEGTLVHIRIINNLLGAVAPTLHWHGFRMSEGYYWYDPLR